MSPLTGCSRPHYLPHLRLAVCPVQVIVATPGRLWDLMREGHAHVTNLSRLSFLVIDEAGEGEGG